QRSARTVRHSALCHPGPPAAFPPLGRPHLGRLGVWPTALVGRVREREEVAALLASDRLVTITGAGGAGKTRLAHAVGEDVADRYADGVVWVELARLLDGAQVAGTIAAACGVRAAAGGAAIDLLPRAPAVARICRRLDGLPLALELAAARVRALSVERLADGLDDRFRLLTGGARTALARQQTLLASVEWSHELLDDPERMLFRRLGVFAAPFDLEAVEAVAADDELEPFEVVDVLARLVDKNMVQPAGERYQLLETLRQYALERAADAGELAELRGRHLAWFRRRAAAWALDRELATFPGLDEIAAEAPDLLAALEWSLGPGRRPAVDLLYALAPYWGRRFAHEELRAVSGQVLAAFDEGSAPWLEALAPVAAELYFATEVGWLPAARRAL